MKVRATRLGYYNHRRRREGDIFEITDEKAFSNKWMEAVDGKPEKSKPSKKSAPPVTQESSEEVI